MTSVIVCLPALLCSAHTPSSVQSHFDLRARHHPCRCTSLGPNHTSVKSLARWEASHIWSTLDLDAHVLARSIVFYSDSALRCSCSGRSCPASRRPPNPIKKPPFCLRPTCATLVWQNIHPHCKLSRSRCSFQTTQRAVPYPHHLETSRATSSSSPTTDAR